MSKVRPTLFRQVSKHKTPYTGPGSFWTPNPDVATKYGEAGILITTVPRGRRLHVDNDEDLIEALNGYGVVDAEDRVYGADWFEEDVYGALRVDNINWIVRLIDPTVSTVDEEWIYTGRRSLSYKIY